MRIASGGITHKTNTFATQRVVIPVMTQHYSLLQRNLIYTAVTRARKLAVLVGNPKAIAIAVRNQESTERHTRLADRLSPDKVSSSRAMNIPTSTPDVEEQE